MGRIKPDRFLTVRILAAALVWLFVTQDSPDVLELLVEFPAVVLVPGGFALVVGPLVPVVRRGGSLRDIRA